MHGTNFEYVYFVKSKSSEGEKKNLLRSRLPFQSLSDET